MKEYKKMTAANKTKSKKVIEDVVAL